VSKVSNGIQVGGSGGGTPDAPASASDTVSSLSIVEFLDGISEGEIEGFATEDPYESIYFGGVPLRRSGIDNFGEIALDFRLGTQNQTYMPGDNDLDGSSSLEYSVSQTVYNDNIGVVKRITSANTDAVNITLKFNAGIVHYPADGGSTTASVELKTEVSANGAPYASLGASIWKTSTYYTITGAEVSFGSPKFVGNGESGGGGEYRIHNQKASGGDKRSILINLKQFGEPPYDIRVTRVSPDEDNTGGGAKTFNEFEWSTYTEITYAKLKYPNTALVKTSFDAKNISSIPLRAYLMKGIKIQVPNVATYDPIARTYTGAMWDGTFVTSWSRNPAWILYDIFTDPRYGLGNEVDASNIDKWSFYQIAKRCDELVDDGVGGLEPRYSLDLYLQQGAGAKKVVQDIASAFDSMVFWGNGSVYITQDRPKDTKAVFTNANVLDGKFVYTGSARQTRFTAATIQWNDPSDDYKIAIEYVEDQDGINRFGFRETSGVAIGCTSRGQAHRFGKRLISTSQLETDIVAFSVGLDGMVVSPGDIIEVFDVLRSNGKRFGGRVADGATLSKVTLDAPATLDSGVTSYISVVSDDGSIITSQITNSSGEHTDINLLTPLSKLPDPLSVWSIYSSVSSQKFFRVIGIAEGEDAKKTTYDITGVQYNPNKYAAIDSPMSLQSQKETLTSVFGELIQPALNLIVDLEKIVNETGVTRNLSVTWLKSQTSVVDHYVVEWSVDGSDEVTISTTKELFFKIETVYPTIYTISVTAVAITGVRSPKSTVIYTVADMLAIDAVVTNDLSVKGVGLEFFGQNAEFSWSTNIDVLLELPTPFSSGGGGMTAWFRDFEVKIFNGVTLVRTEYVAAHTYIYDFNKNKSDGGGTPHRDITIQVSARGHQGGLSTASAISVSNPPPGVFSNISLVGGTGNIFVEYSQPTDQDYAYTRVYASQTTGFVPDSTPSTGNLVFEGSERVLSFPVEQSGTWFIVLQGVDKFGPYGLIYSSQLSELVTSVDVAADVEALLADPGREGDFVIDADRFIVTIPDTHGDPTAVFGVGTVNDVATVGIKGDLLIDGTVATQKLSAGAITADKINVIDLSAVSANMGEVTAGTFKTNPLDAAYRVEISDVGSFPMWYGAGEKTLANAKFAMDHYGNALFSGNISGGTININSGQFSVSDNGHVEMHSMTIYDALGNVVMSSGVGDTGGNNGSASGLILEWDSIQNKPSDSRLYTNMLNVSSWVVGSGGSQGGFTQRPFGLMNSIALEVGPYGDSQPVWVISGGELSGGLVSQQSAIDAASGNVLVNFGDDSPYSSDANQLLFDFNGSISGAEFSDINGGWSNKITDFDSKKTHRLAVWAKKDTFDGTFIFATNGSYVTDLTGGVHDGVFFSGNLPNTNKWYLLIGVIHGDGYTGGQTGMSGIYDPNTGNNIFVFDDLKNVVGAVAQYHAVHLSYDGGSVVGDTMLARPRFDEINGAEPTIQSIMAPIALLNSNTTPDDIGYTGDLDANNFNNTNQLADGAGLGLTAAWSGVGGTGRPSDNATVGGQFGVNISGQITAATASTYIASAAIDIAHINAATVNTLTAGTAVIGTASITSAMIQNAAITSAKIQDLAVDTLKLAGNSVTVLVSANGSAATGTLVTVGITIPAGGGTVLLTTP